MIDYTFLKTKPKSSCSLIIQIPHSTTCFQLRPFLHYDWEPLSHGIKKLVIGYKSDRIQIHFTNGIVNLRDF